LQKLNDQGEKVKPARYAYAKRMQAGSKKVKEKHMKLISAVKFFSFNLT